MARAKEYIREDVIDAATRVFWTKGFKGTSVRDLVIATGLNKHSMYQEFGSKEGLFRECLDNFGIKAISGPFTLLTKEPLGFGNIEAFFRDRVDYSSRTRAGCLLVNTTVEKELVDVDAFGKAQGYLSRLEESLYNCLAAAKASGDIRAEKDCHVLANYLLNIIVGMMVMSKLGPNKESLEAMVGVALSTIKA